MRDSRGLVYSTAIHAVLLFLLIIGLPDFFHRQMEPEPEAISVDILPIAPISNVKPQEKAPETQEKKPVEEKRIEKKAAPETKKEEPKPVEQPESISAKEVVKKLEKKPEKKKPEEKKKAEDPLKAILNDVKAHAKAEEGKKPAEQKAAPDAHPAKSQTYDASQPLSMSQKDAIRSQIEQCWNAPVGAKDAQNLIVTLHLELEQDGTVTKVELAHDSSRYNSDSFFRAAADAAIRAVTRCSPIKNLPVDKYGTWRDMEMDFNPHDMLN